MKRDAVILVVAMIILTALAYQARPMEKAGITSVYAVEETECVGDTEVVEAVAIAEEVVEVEEVQAGFVMYSPIWDMVQMTFYPDGSCVFELPEHEVYEQCKWTYAEGVLSVVRQDGKVFTSYMAEDRATLRLDYEAMVHKDLIGQFSSIDYKEFFEGENTETTEV